MNFVMENFKAIVVILSIPIWLNAGASCARANAREARIKIAIIDTGYDASLIKSGPKLKLCKYGHFNFANGKAEVASVLPHGTQVASIIAKELENVDYCAVIYNVMSNDHTMLTENVVSAFYKASYQTLAAINASYTAVIKTVSEREAVKDAAKRVDKIFVAAGNHHKNLDFECDEFPVCFDVPNMVAVGALNASRTKRLESSNYGSRIKSWFPGDYDGKVEGTSYASPRALSSYVQELDQLLTTR